MSINVIVVGGVGLLLDAAARRVTVGMLGDWWNAPADYQGQVEYFAKRSLTGLIRLLIGLGVGIVGFVTFVAQFSAASPGGMAVRVVSGVFAASMVLWNWWWWLRPWPTHRVSQFFIINVDIGVTVVTLLNQRVLSGMFGLSTLIVISFYIIFFDSVKILVLHSIWVALSITALAVQITIMGGGDVVMAVAKVLSGGALAIAPIAAHFGIWALRNDANEATTDPLTGLLNRRGLNLHIGDLLQRDYRSTADLVVVVIDLDRFKDVNDRFGHTAGDKVLVRCARRLESAATPVALVARTGGEEFVVVDVLESADCVTFADRIRIVLSGDDDQVPVTASVGVTDVSVTGFTGSDRDRVDLLGALIARADDAMYVAKRLGGDAVRRLPSQSTLFTDRA